MVGSLTSNRTRVRHTSTRACIRAVDPQPRPGRGARIRAPLLRMCCNDAPRHRSPAARHPDVWRKVLRLNTTNAHPMPAAQRLPDRQSAEFAVSKLMSEGEIHPANIRPNLQNRCSKGSNSTGLERPDQRKRFEVTRLTASHAEGHWFDPSRDHHQNAGSVVVSSPDLEESTGGSGDL
jgi:hypothetical protein